MIENKNIRTRIGSKYLPTILEAAFLQWEDDKALKVTASLSFYQHYL